MYALVNHVTIYHCFLSINNIVSHAFSARTAVQRGVIAVEVNIAGPFKHASIRKRYNQSAIPAAMIASRQIVVSGLVSNPR